MYREIRKHRDGVKGVLLGLAFLALCTASRGQEAQEPLLPELVEEVEPTVVGFEEEEFADPLEGLNRRIFRLNDVLYRHALIPLGRAWLDHVPSPVRTGTANFFHNLTEPLDAVNHLLQGELRRAGRNMARFAVNTTAGLLGFFDPADAWMELEAADTSLNATLAGHGVGSGPYLVVPLLGPSHLRGSLSSTVETLASPLREFAGDPEAIWLQSLDNFQANAPATTAYEDLYAQSEDPYRYFRNQFLQGERRDQEALREAPQSAETPDEGPRTAEDRLP